jgi:hypothetical protein
MLGGAVTPSAVILLEGEWDAERAGFEILWRETTDARWSVLRTIDTGNRTSPSSTFEETLSSVSTDNHYFAARSVGKNGKRSRAVPAVAAVRRPPGTVAADAPKPAASPAPRPDRSERKE